MLTDPISDLDLVPAQIALLDRSGRIDFVNHQWMSFARENGYLGDEFVGTNYLETCYTTVGAEEPQAREVALGIRDVLSGNQLRFETVYPCHSPDTKRWFKVIAAGTGTKVIVTHVDFSKEYLRFHRASKAMDTAKIVHDLRSPLTAVLGFADLGSEFLEKDLDTERLKKYFNRISESAHLMMVLVDDLLETINQTADPLNLQNDAIGLSGLLDEICEEFEVIAEKQSVRIETNVSSDISLLADRKCIRKIFSNLVSNAIKYNKAGGAVSISGCLNDARGIEISIRDTGIGMDPENVGSIFEPFCRLTEDQDVRSVRGNGLGLSIVKDLVECHEGRITVATGRGVGSEFVVIFPTWRTLQKQGKAL